MRADGVQVGCALVFFVFDLGFRGLGVQGSGQGEGFRVEDEDEGFGLKV